MPLFGSIKKWFSRDVQDQELHERLQKLRERAPVPLFWLFGKTQSGKTSIVKYLSGADNAEIGRGFRPCTRFSRQYEFPTPDAPLMSFLDTRGVDEPGYDVKEDLDRFNNLAHVVIVTVKALDHAQENVLKQLKTIRQAAPGRPVVLALTCLHEAYPQQQQPTTYPYVQVAATTGNQAGGQTSEVTIGPWRVDANTVPEELRRSLAEQCQRFAGLFDAAVPIDLTRPEEGFVPADFGGDPLKQSLLHVLPGAYRRTLLSLEEANRSLQELHLKRAMPYIIGYSTLAATAGAFPIPWVDLLVLPSIQTSMIYHLARVYGQSMDANRIMELAGTMGSGMMVRQAAREMLKFIPYVGAVASGAMAATSTYALGKAFCHYYQSVHQGHVPKNEEMRRYYQEQLVQAEQAWRTIHKKETETDGTP